jgi:hypothetical protein
MLSKSLQMFIGERCPGLELNKQQMAAVARWLRKEGFVIKKVYNREARRQIATIFFSETQPLPTNCPCKAAERTPYLDTSPFHVKTYIESLHAYIGNLHTLIEILFNQLERIKNVVSLGHHPENYPGEPPKPPETVTELLRKYELDQYRPPDSSESQSG